MDFFNDIFISIFFFLDKIIYLFITVMYNLFMDISNTALFSNATLKTFSNRIYILLGVFMLFKLTFSFLSFMVNPETINDKERGAGKIVGKVIITLVLLISLPSIFSTAYSIQSIILKDNTIGRIIMGVNPQYASNVNTAGQDMSFTIFNGFFRPKICVSNNITDVDQCAEAITDGTAKAAYVNAYKYKDLSYYDSVMTLKGVFKVKQSDGTEVTKNTYIFDYTYLISTIAGGFTVFILLGFVIDVGVRSVKLGFLQLVAPIPVASYIDPKSSKDGAFANWLKACTSTYLDLFTRLILIYFVVFVIGEILRTGIVDMTKCTVPGDLDTCSKVTNPLIQIFIILGALMFAKQAPQLIKDILGIKGDSGGFSLNPMKKFNQIPVAGSLGAGAAGAVGGLMAGGGLAGMAKGAMDGAKAVPMGGLDKNGKGGNGMSGFRTGANAIKAAQTGDPKAQYQGVFGKMNQGLSNSVASDAAAKAQVADAKADMINRGAEFEESAAYMKHYDDAVGINLANYGSGSTQYMDAFNEAQTYRESVYNPAKSKAEESKRQYEKLKKENPGPVEKTKYKAIR